MSNFASPAAKLGVTQKRISAQGVKIKKQILRENWSKGSRVYVIGIAARIFIAAPTNFMAFG